MVKVKEDLSKRQFGLLTVIEQAEDYVTPSGQHQAMWLCKCECGNIKAIRAATLKNGTSSSCGCIQKGIVKQLGKTHKKNNTYDLSGEYGIGYTSNTNQPFYFDLEDYDKIKDYCWSEDNNGYIVTEKNKRRILLHILIMNTETGVDVDHIHHKRYDNRKSELRIVTRSQNQIAVKARKEAEEKYFGEYSYDNSVEQRKIPVRKRMKMEEKIAWDNLYEYVKKNILRYDDEQCLPYKVILRLKGLVSGKYLENQNIKDKAKYSYELILLTFKYCCVDIERALRNKTFKDEIQKFNYVAAIVENNINTVYVRMQQAEKSKDKTEKMDTTVATHTGASYQRKTKDVSSKFDDLW